MSAHDPLLHSQSVAHVHGAATYRQRATFGLRLGAYVVDGALGLAIFFLIHRAQRLSPIPELGWPIAIVAILGLNWAAQRAFATRTVGDAVWKLRTERKGWAQPLLRPLKVSTGEILRGAFLTVMAIIASAWAIDQAIFRQPIWARAEMLELDAFLPDMASDQWTVLPFFYSLGAWPKIYGNRPVFYSLPYEKGPPTRFVGHLIARWDDPGTRVTFEGPKTPQTPAAQKGDHAPRDLIRHCLLGETHSWECLKIREATLLRHLNDMQQRLAGKSGGNTALKMRWRVRWFVVRNGAIAPAEQAQGIYLSAEDGEPGTADSRGEERYVLITENGTHQSIALAYADPGSNEAKHARDTFEQSIRSLRASDELGPGRAWVDRQLQSVKLDDLAATDSAKTPSANATDTAADAALAAQAKIARLAEVQSLLLAKITVQPGIYDSYFHLGGTSLLLNRIARAGATAGKLEGLELAAVAKPLIQSAYRYAQDVAPADPKTTQLQGFWLESQKP